MWHSFKKKIGIKKVIDDKFEEHREQFSRLVRELKYAFRNEGFMLVASVLPNINSSSKHIQVLNIGKIIIFHKRLYFHIVLNFSVFRHIFFDGPS